MPDEKHPFCGHCGDRLPHFGAVLGLCGPCARRFKSAARSAAAPARPVSQLEPEGMKDPVLALVLSAAVPGGGQLYNGHFLKAVLIFATSFLVLPYIIGIVDAFFSARRINGKRSAETVAFA